MSPYCLAVSFCMKCYDCFAASVPSWEGRRNKPLRSPQAEPVITNETVTVRAGEDPLCGPCGWQRRCWGLHLWRSTCSAPKASSEHLWLGKSLHGVLGSLPASKERSGYPGGFATHLQLRCPVLSDPSDLGTAEISHRQEHKQVEWHFRDSSGTMQTSCLQTWVMAPPQD